MPPVCLYRLSATCKWTSYIISGFFNKRSWFLIPFNLMFVQLCYLATVEVEPGSGERTTSIMAGITEWQQNPDTGFYDHCLSRMFLDPHEIKPIWQSHIHMNYELKTLNLLHCNCLWSFKVTVQTICIIANHIIYRTLTGYIVRI